MSRIGSNNFHGWRRKVGCVLLALAAYISAYCAIVESEPSGVYQTGVGPFPKTAVYPIGGATGLGKVRGYPFDAVTHPVFALINLIDRTLQPSVWYE